MVEKKSTEMAELLDRIVCTSDSLHAFLASHTHTNMGGSDHAHVVSSIAAT